MDKHFAWVAFGWGFLLWLIGYALGIAFFMLLPPQMIGWAIAPIGTAITVGVAWRHVRGRSARRRVGVAAVWLASAALYDLLFLVLLLHPADGYYKPSVYLYYALTFIIPIAVGALRGGPRNQSR
jgi:hypothetical protein